MSTPTMTTAGDELHMFVPFSLNGAFRAIFKTAKWNADGKVFKVSATTQNRNKWVQFSESVKAAVEALANADHVEATTEELVRAAQEAELVVNNVQASIKDCEQRAIAARLRTVRAKEQLVEFAPMLEISTASLADVLDTTAAAEMARDAVIAPAISLYKSHGLEYILADFVQAVRRGHSGKEARGRAKADIAVLRNNLKSLGFRLPAIDDLALVSLNRTDKILEFVASVEATLYSGLEATKVKGESEGESEVAVTAA